MIHRLRVYQFEKQKGHLIIPPEEGPEICYPERKISNFILKKVVFRIFWEKILKSATVILMIDLKIGTLVLNHFSKQIVYRDNEIRQRQIVLHSYFPCYHLIKATYDAF